jgi:hypothetical protein
MNIENNNDGVWKKVTNKILGKDNKMILQYNTL